MIGLAKSSLYHSYPEDDRRLSVETSDFLNARNGSNSSNNDSNINNLSSTI